MGINKLFERGARLFPDRPCLTDAAGSKSYREVEQVRDRIAGGIVRAFGPQARCGVYSPNSARAFEHVLAIYRAGGIYVPLPAKSHPDEVAAVIEDSGVAAVFFAAELSGEVAGLRSRLPAVAFLALEDFEAENADAGPRHLPALPEDRDRIVSIYSTGGTTGRPKGVMFTALTWEIMAANFLAALRLDERPPIYLVVTPMTHAAGTLAFPLFAVGASIVILDRFDAALVLEAIERYGVTHLFLPPTAIYMLLDQAGLREHDYSSLAAFMYAAAPMSVAKLKQCIEVFGSVMMQFWGQTEAPMFCTCLMPEEHVIGDPRQEERLRSCGRPMLLTRVEVMDDDGRLLPAGEKGELVVRGNIVMAGYHGNDAATEESRKHGWHHTGDVGYRDRDGYVYIVDRKKDMIITGGMNVFPSEVEQVILAHPAVLDCAVIGVPDEKWGEAVKAVIELRPRAALSGGELLAYCKDRLGSVKAPKTVEFWDALPRTPVGKVSRKDIRARYWTGRERAI